MVENIWRRDYGRECVAERVWYRMYGVRVCQSMYGKSIWLRMCGGESMVENVWWREYVRECMAERIWQRMYGGESILENVWRENMVEYVW